VVEVEQKANEGALMVFSVVVSDSAGRTHHRVTLMEATYQRLTGGRITPLACIEAAFRFLLERQSKGDILPSFDLNVLQLSHANFDKEFPNYL
jgi:hypothetical protein